MKKISFLSLLFLLLLFSNLCIAEQQNTSNNGRYIIYQNSQFRGDQFLLDTKTGKVWQLVKGEEGGTLWQQMIFENLNDTNKYTYSPKPQ